MRRDRRSGRRSRPDRPGACRAQGWHVAEPGNCKKATGSRQGDNRAVQISAIRQIHRRAAENPDRQDSAFPLEAKNIMSETVDMTEPHSLLHPRGWKQAKGFANGVVAEGRMVFLAGQIGWNAQQKFETSDFVLQARQALENIVTLVEEAGGKAAHITRLTWFVTDKKEYMSRLSDLGQAYRAIMGTNFPAMTLVQVVALVEDEAKVEIEATAVLPV